ncbi:hypothetical protein CKO28_13435 [Rhodovibrio sodomensis]|uniref:Uncharacterized protein n=1 Tax=Rhodovibrio sodomensis TaxID=1088 RepID=A0ABS1DI19_9PROT|nr:hypothetical protein [Rhodovibrio sodomensis]MBK1669035.1 hypothetical protein [Rhodovibrio sodomensis]
MPKRYAVRRGTLESKVAEVLRGERLCRWKTGADPISGTDGSIHAVEVYLGNEGSLTVGLREFVATTPANVEAVTSEAWGMGYGVAVEKEHDDPEFGPTILMRPPSRTGAPVAVSGICDWVLAEPGDYEEERAAELLTESGEDADEVAVEKLSESLRSESVIHFKLDAIVDCLADQLESKGISVV